MIIYRRNISNRLLALRVSFFIATLLCVFAFKYHFENLGYFLSVLLVTSSIIIVNDFVVTDQELNVSKYYMYGFIKINWKYLKNDQIKISSYGSDFGKEGEIPDFQNTSDLGCLFSIFAVFLPYRITKKSFTLERLGESIQHKRQVQILLNEVEFGHLQKFVINSHCK